MLSYIVRACFYIKFRAEPLCTFYSSIIKPKTFQISISRSSHYPQVVTKVHEDLLLINKFLEIAPSTAFQARAVTGRLLCLQLTGAISLGEHFIASVHVPLLYRVKSAILWLATTV